MEHKNGHGGELQRNLQNRHLQLIAIGGAIGTGLFMGSGKTIHLAGSFGAADLYRYRFFSVFRDAGDGRTAFVQPVIQILYRFCA